MPRCPGKTRSALRTRPLGPTAAAPNPTSGEIKMERVLLLSRSDQVIREKLSRRESPFKETFQFISPKSATQARR